MKPFKQEFSGILTDKRAVIKSVKHLHKEFSEILTDQMIQKSSEHAILTIIVVLTDQSLIRNIPNQDI